MQKSEPPSPSLLEGLRHYLGIMMSAPQETRNWSYFNFTRKVKKRMLQGHFKDLLGEINVQMLQLRREAAYLYDAVKLYAESLKIVLLQGGDPFNGSLIIQNLVNQTYFSAMGYKVFMDANGDTEGNFSLVALGQTSQGKPGLFPVGVFQLDGPNVLPKLHLTHAVAWPRGNPPRAIPRCGFKGELCLTEETDEDIVFGVFLGFGVVLVVIVIVLYRNYKYEQELDSLLWKIDPKELKIDEFTPTCHNYHGTLSKAHLASSRRARNSQVSLGSNQENDHRFSMIYTQIGVYKGRIYGVKKSPKASIDITRKLKKELKAMRDIHHDNLNHFIGACVEPGNVCIVYEYCTRGSLRDVLDNDDMNLDNMFIASLVGDIIRGMIFLHESQLRFHGNLKAANCLVDSRWVLKLSGFGLSDFSHPWPNVLDVITGSVSLDPLRSEELLYRAPEMLRLKDPSKLLDMRYISASEIMLQKADVYSFAILFYEIHFRPSLPFTALHRNRVGTRPFGNVDMTVIEVLERIYNPHVQLRPQIDALNNCVDFVKSCMRDCWQEVPNDRPDFKVIRSRLRPMRRGMKANIFDNMLAMMEKYANNLESLVDERTQLLIDEKRKTEALLYEMLPRTVAEQLKQGKRVDAENFDSVTIYFSDIVGFTSMCAESSPLQVVDFLNDLYTCFDSTIEIYDVYKVETIGDAYMVVSGLPVRNADQHAGEVASMALNLLDRVKRFTIQHRPHDALMLRIGIHSGPVCAGVVGRKMPRFCLFGDTVNTASRMESTGAPLKIHCSSSCYQILSKLGGYELEERGFVNIKGKGDQLTFWLLNEDPFIREQRMTEREQQLKSQKRPASIALDFLRTDYQPIQRNSSRKKRPSKDSTSLTESPSSDAKRLRFGLNKPITEETQPNETHPTNEEDVFLPSVHTRTPRLRVLDQYIIDVANPTPKRNSCPCIDNMDPAFLCPDRDYLNRSDSGLAPKSRDASPDSKSIGHTSLSSILQHIGARHDANECLDRSDEENAFAAFKAGCSTSCKKSDHRNSFKLTKILRRNKSKPNIDLEINEKEAESENLLLSAQRR
ncbi:guanylate cyclase 32E-like [Tigriopus californicus]|uniref:guanylate cyclase 32E-like n=1 Tax=Tigriopus californicus TaxID=6832 RepID=UPI0027D9E744|nr:guanylate cyclase 32E-like [Tigriopus californicus]